MAIESKGNPSQSNPPTKGANPILVGVFDDRWEAQRALDDLQQAKFTRQQLGFVLRGSAIDGGDAETDAAGKKDAHGAATGAVAGGVLGGLLGAAVSLVIPGVGPVLAAGILATALGYAGAGVAIGGILGAMAGDELTDEEARYYEKHFNDGRALVIVRAPAREAEATAIIRRHGGYDMHNPPTTPRD
jgi:hypothetical protein